MIRNDFVSNSSSSSYIISTKKPISDLIDYIVKGAVNTSQYDWNDYCNKQNREFLEERLEPVKYTALAFACFNIVGEDKPYFMEDYEKATSNGKNFGLTIVKNSDIKNYVENGVIKIKYEDLLKPNPKHEYNGYKVFQITQDSIDFTRWIYNNYCVDRDTNEDIKNLENFMDNELTKDQRNYLDPLTEDQKKKVGELYKKCCGLIIKPQYTEYVNGKHVAHKLSELLDEYEKKLKDGYQIYRICFGTRGEGTDWNSYVWYCGGDFLKGNEDFIFEYDPMW